MLKLLLCLHGHQPIGNFDRVFSEATRCCYRPLLEILGRHPLIKVSLHYSGCLLEWLEENQPDMLDMLAGLVERGQIELLAGGFYEPMLCILPRQDAQDQISLLCDYLKKRFGYRARGFWLTERVWEPGIPKIVEETGLEYTIIDDTHFLYAGVRARHLKGYFITEDNGCVLSLFPGDKHLRYLIPFQPENELEAYFKKLDSEEKKIICYGDDQEKFGLWPGTAKWVFEEGWMERFLTMLEKNNEWLQTEHLSEILDSTPPLGRVYIPTASYEEMMQWALPAEAAEDLEDIVNEVRATNRYDYFRTFLRGGFWRNFLAKYSESNTMHKRMLEVSKRLKNDRKLSARKRRIVFNELAKGTCNCGYWHGIFGGIYLPHLRRVIYEHLIRADSMIDKYGESPEPFYRGDFDRDGYEEVCLANSSYRIFLSPNRGGSIYEMDFIPGCWNLVDTLTRRREAYHRQILKEVHKLESQESPERASIHELSRSVEKGVIEELCYDKYPRVCLLDHFIPSETRLGSFSRCTHQELGDFSGRSYTLVTRRRHGNHEMVLKSEWQGDGSAFARVEKSVLLMKESEGIEVNYRIDADLGDTFFGSEFNIACLPGKGSFYTIDKDDKCRLDLSWEKDNVCQLAVVDGSRHMEITMAFSPVCRLWMFPVFTVSQSEKGYEKTQQNVALVALWPAKGKSHIKITMKIEEGKKHQ